MNRSVTVQCARSTAAGKDSGRKRAMEDRVIRSLIAAALRAKARQVLPDKIMMRQAETAVDNTDNRTSAVES